MGSSAGSRGRAACWAMPCAGGLLPACKLLALVTCTSLAHPATPAARAEFNSGQFVEDAVGREAEDRSPTFVEDLDNSSGDSAIGCCFQFRLPASGRDAPCCLKTQQLDQNSCFKRSTANSASPGSRAAGWTSSCPGDALEASKWIHADQWLVSSLEVPENTSSRHTNTSRAHESGDAGAAALPRGAAVAAAAGNGTRRPALRSGACRALPESTRIRNVLDVGSDPDGFTSGGPFTQGTVLEVSCDRGFIGSRRSWELNCSTGGAWKAQRQDGTMPDCRPKPCKGPPDPVGTWKGLPGQSLHLMCADGYVPDDGTPVIGCEGEEEELKPAHCVPSEGSARRWRSRLRRQALVSLLGVATVVVIIVAACWRRPARTIRQPNTEHMSDRFVAETERPNEVHME